jgi:hypothetical protein
MGSSLFYPFRLFEFISHFSRYQFLVNYLNTLFRLIPAFGVYLVIAVVIFLCWGLGLFIILAPNVFEFSSYLESIASVIYRNFYEIREYNSLLTSKNSAIYQLVVLITFSIRFLLFTIIIALTSYLYKKATSF